jgi:rubrerythrin
MITAHTRHVSIRYHASTQARITTEPADRHPQAIYTPHAAALDHAIALSLIAGKLAIVDYRTAAPVWECPSCGRVYDDITGGPCPSDDCPSHDHRNPATATTNEEK